MRYRLIIFRKYSNWEHIVDTILPESFDMDYIEQEVAFHLFYGGYSWDDESDPLRPVYKYRVDKERASGCWEAGRMVYL